MLETERTRLCKSIQTKDDVTSSHCSKTSNYALRLGYSLGLNNRELAVLKLSAVLHDIGKINVPDNILLKPSGLDHKEFEIIKNHSVWGAQIVANCSFDSESCLLADSIRHHHERYDGKGYPDGLKGDAIPLFSQIIAVADTYDAMTSNRAYRKAMKMEDAVQVLQSERGKQFQPLLVNRFLDFIVPHCVKDKVLVS